MRMLRQPSLKTVITIGLLGLDGLVYALACHRLIDMLIVVSAAVIIGLPMVQQSVRAMTTLALFTCIGLVIVQWPDPRLWCLDVAVCIHILSLIKDGRLWQVWRPHAVIVAGLVVCWYSLNGNRTGWYGPILIGSVVGLLFCTWFLVGFIRATTTVNRALVLSTLSVLASSLLVGLLVEPSVSLGAQYSRQLIRPETDEGGSAGKTGGQLPNQGLGLTYNGEGANSDIRAYLALQPSKGRKDQYKTPLYLRQRAYSIFTGKRWVTFSKKMEIRKDTDDGKNDSWTQTHQAVHPFLADYQVYLPDVRSPWLPTLAGTTSLNVKVVSMTTEESYHVTSRRGALITYQGKAAIFNYSELAEGMMEPGDSPAHYYQMPETDITDRLQELTFKVIGDASEPADKIRRIEHYLKTSTTYQLQTDENRATLENFLFGEKKGHCTLYATASTLMLRIAGIPTRLAVGFCGGKRDPKAGVYAFDSGSAHAWTEFKTRDHGWIILDPTPPAVTEPGLVANSDFSQQIEAYSSLERERVRDPQENLADVGAFSSGRLQMLLLLIIAAGTMSIYVLSARSRGRGCVSTVSPNRQFSSNLATDFFHRFCQVYAGRGLVKKRHQTGWEYIQCLRVAGQINDEWDDMIAYYYSVCYEGKPNSAAQEQQFLERINALN